MACEAIHTWSFCDLVGAFLDLAIVYLLLCGSTLAFFASKFLGFFGLCLPCPCNGLFGNPDISICLQRLLVDCPIERVSSVQLSVKNKFPFDSIWAKAQSCQLNLKLVRDGNYENGRVEFEGEASCSSVSESLGGRDSVPLVGFGVKEGRFDVKGKGVVNSRPRYGLRRRRKCAVDYGKFLSVLSYDPPRSDVRATSRSTSSVGKIGNEIVEESLVPVNSGDHDDRETPMVILGERVLHEFELNEPLDENNPTEKDSSSVEEFRHNARRELGFDGNEKNAIRILEQALEEELAARSALYLELEKERSAAATAADEAMAMILRLQEEKGSIEMEARQYQRIIEEKSAYDAEEMNILKEILLRREREKHVLEKEVEAYRQMMFSRSEQLEGDVHEIVDSQGQRLASSLDSSEDPVLMLQRLSEYIAKKEKVKNANRCSDCELTSVEKQNCILALGKELPIPELDEDADFSKEGDIHSRPNIDKYHPHTTRLNNECHQEFQEKGMVSMDENPYAQQSEVQRLGIRSQLYRSNSSQEPNLREKTITLVGEEQEQNDNTNSCQGIAPKTVETHNDAEIYIPYEGEDLEKHGKDAAQGSKDPLGSIFDTEPRVHDVHVIDDESNVCSEVNGSSGERRSVNATLDVLRKCDLPYEVSESWRLDVLSDCPTTSRSQSGPDVNRISSDMISGLPPMGSSRGKALLSDLRRNSMSAVENERLKIDTEVGWLRERLRIVQEGREKLNFSVEHRERENIQLQLLEDIAHQLREIRQLTEPGKAVRQASLPLPSSKVTSKKRRCRSVSLGVHQSS